MFKKHCIERGEKMAEKEIRAMEQDAEAVNRAYEALVRFDQKPLRIRIKDPAKPDQFLVEITGRPLSGPEILAYYKKLERIHPGLLHKGLADVPLSAAQTEQLYDLYDEYITLSTGIPQEKLRERTNRIRFLLMIGIMRGSNPTAQELEDIAKFRDLQ